MESQVAPIEDRVRAMVVDIVRTCQSTVAQNYHRTVAPASLANSQMRSSSQTIASTGSTVPTYQGLVQPSSDSTAGDPLDFFREPALLNLEASLSFPDPVYNHNSLTASQNRSSDSGYGTLQSPCDCSCHDYSDTWNTANGEYFLGFFSDL